MIGLGLKFLFVIAAFCIILLSTISSQYQSTDGSLSSSMNQTDSNTNTNQSVALDKNQTKNQIPNSTIGIAKPTQNTTKQNSNFSSAAPAHHKSRSDRTTIAGKQRYPTTTTAITNTSAASTAGPTA